MNKRKITEKLNKVSESLRNTTDKVEEILDELLEKRKKDPGKVKDFILWLLAEYPAIEHFGEWDCADWHSVMELYGKGMFPIDEVYDILKQLHKM